jgi:ribosomal protein S18 acetylase RimI-like enzyme
MITIRPATEHDADAIWPIFHAVIAGGDTFAFPPDMTRADALAFWYQPTGRAYVAEINGVVVGGYLLKPNMPGLGSHVANAAYIVAPECRGQGVGEALGRHSLVEAARLGYRAMQFHLVVATNESAVRLWKRLGFATLATLPGAFRHATLGFVDAYIMWRDLP